MFCSELCFSQCRRASFKKNKICNWCKHVRHTVNYVDFFDGKSQLQFCSTKCLGQYKMNILCREIEMIPPRLLHSLQSPTSPSDSPARLETLTSPQLPVDLCMKRKASSQTSDVAGKREEQPSDADADDRTTVLDHFPVKRHKSLRKSCEDQAKGRERLPNGRSSARNDATVHAHHLRTQQLQLQQLHQLQTRMSLTPESLFRSLNGSVKGRESAGQHRLFARRDSSLESRSLAVPPSVLPSFLHQHNHHDVPCASLRSPLQQPQPLPPPPLHSRLFASSSPPQLLSSSAPLPPADVTAALVSMKSESASASSSSLRPAAPASRRRASDHANTRMETPAAQSSSARPLHPRPPLPSLLLPMPVVLPLPLPIPLFLFQQKALQRIEQLAAEMKQECKEGSAGRRVPSEDKSTQSD